MFQKCIQYHHTHMFQGHLQCYIGACTRLRRCACAPEHIQYYCTVYEVQEEGCSTSTVVRGVGVAPPRLIYKKKIDTCTWTPNSHKARQEDNVIGATSRQVHVILQYKPIVQYMILPKPRRYLFCADICSVPCAP